MKLPNKFSEKTNLSIILILTQLGYIISQNLRLSLLCLMASSLILKVWLNVPVPEISTLLLLITLPIEAGIRGWMIGAAWPTMFSSMSDGYSYYFGIRIANILTVSTILLIMPILKKYRVNRINGLLLGWVVCSLISSVLAPQFLYAITGFYIILMSYCLYLIGQSGIIHHSSFINISVTIFAILGLIGTVQGIIKKPLSLYFESTYYSQSFYTTDGITLYRASGLSGHPTFFGSLLSLLFPIVFNEWIQKKSSSIHILETLSLILGTTAIFFTASRSAYIATTLSAAVILFITKQLRTKKWLLLLIPIFISFGAIANRLSSVFDYFTPQGNNVGRVKLIQEAITQITQSPFFGVGPNHFTTVMSERINLDPNLQNFIYPVHNTWLLFASELGVPALIMFISFVILSLIKNVPKKSISNLGIWLSIITFIINSQFHTLFSQDVSFSYFMLILGIINHKQI